MTETGDVPQILQQDTTELVSMVPGPTVSDRPGSWQFILPHALALPHSLSASKRRRVAGQIPFEFREVGVCLCPPPHSASQPLQNGTLHLTSPASCHLTIAPHQGRWLSGSLIHNDTHVSIKNSAWKVLLTFIDLCSSSICITDWLCNLGKSLGHWASVSPSGPQD